MYSQRYHRFVTYGVCLTASLLVMLTTAHADTTATESRIVTSIRPIHSLVSTVMQGVDAPDLLLAGTDSPHDFTLRPSDARRLQDAELIFWTGPDIEAFLVGPLQSLSSSARVVGLGDATGSEASMRSAETHVWLDPMAAIDMLDRIAEALSRQDPVNAERYQENAERGAEALRILMEQIAVTLEPVATRPFVVFHDAYRPFQHRFGLGEFMTVLADAHRLPGAERIRSLRRWIEANEVGCLFVEPQFSSRVAETIIEGSEVRIAELDPLGSALEPGVDLYPVMLENLASSLVACLEQD